jgi:hypothetical protein
MKNRLSDLHHHPPSIPPFSQHMGSQVEIISTHPEGPAVKDFTLGW